MKAVFAIVVGILLLMLIFAIFPMILAGSDTVNQTTNATYYLGLTEINSIAPLLIYIFLIFGVMALVVWWVFGKKISRFFRR